MSKTTFVFPGQGSQWLGMGIELLDSSEVFAKQIDACEAALAEFVDWSLVDVLRGVPGAPGLDRVDVVQPALFAIMVSLAELWRSVGVTPDAVIGHSQGEIAAAHVAGALSLRDAARVVALRSKLLVALSGEAGMVSLACGADRARELLVDLGDRAGIAAVNGRSAVVVSGDGAALDELVRQCEALEIRARRIDVDYASHSVRVEPIRDELLASLAGIEPSSTRTAFFSTVTGDLVDTATLDADYWYRNIRQTVQFDQAVRTACGHGYRAFVECSPHPALIAGIEDAVNDCTDAATPPVVVPSLGRDDGGLDRFLASAAQAFVAGIPVSWRSVCGGGQHVELPTYAFERRRFWLSGGGSGSSDATGFGQSGASHALLGAVVEVPESGQVLLTGRLAASSQSWLSDHAVGGVVLFPGAGFVELVIRAGDEVGCPVVEELTLQAPLVVPPSGVPVRVLVGAADESGSRAVSVFSRPGDSESGSDWTLHAEAVVTAGSPVTPGADLSVWPPAGAIAVDVTDAYASLAARGYEYGPAFRGLTAMWRRGDEVFAEVALPQDLQAGEFGVHPALLDASLHALALAADDQQLALPFSWQRVSLHAAGASAVRVRLAPTGVNSVSIELADGLGLPVLSVGSMTARPITAEQLAGAGRVDTGGEIFEVEWSPATPAGAARTACRRRRVVRIRPGGNGFHRPRRPRARRHPRRARAAAVLVGGTVGRAAGRDARRDGVGRRGRHRPGRVRGVGPGACGPDGEPGPHRARRCRRRGRDVDRLRSSRSANRRWSCAAASRTPHAWCAAAAPTGCWCRRTRASRGDWASRPQGTFDNLVLEEVPGADQPLQPGYVRVEMRAIAANFRDVMITLGMFTHDALLGSEGSGVVVEVGPGVTEFAVGDRVMALFPDGTGTLVAGRRAARRPHPRRLVGRRGGRRAGGVHHGVLRTARARRRWQPGQSILIHAATGGVGMAAVQLARHWGLEVFATASRGKWDTLRAMGFDDDHIGDSRSLDFEQKFLVATGGRGFDVVLDSLAGEFVDASLRLLPRGGVFLEMGKTDIRDADAVAAAHPGVRYRAFDLFEPGRTRMGEYIVELSRMFAEGVLRAAAGHDVGRAACPRGAAAPEPGPPHRQDRHDDARRVGQRHRADHRRHRHGGRRGGPPPRRPSRRPRPAAAVPARGAGAGRPSSWSRI